MAADARLIAEAPAMLETLQFIVEAYSRANLADWNAEVVAEELEDIYSQADAIFARIR